MVTCDAEFLHEKQLVTTLTNGKLDLLIPRTWEQDDIASCLGWGTSPHFGSRPIEYCKLYQLKNGYLARVRIPLVEEDDRHKVQQYVDHMKKLCYGDDLKGRVTEANYRIKRNYMIVYFHIESLANLDDILYTQSLRETDLQVLGWHLRRN